MNSAFASVVANGTWTLRFLDCSSGSTGTVSAANLILTPVAGPTAADASITGRVRTSTGAGVNGAKVTLSGGTASAASVLTNAFGYFTFPAVESGQTYVVSVSSKRYTFVEPVQVINENVAGVDFQSLQ
ncbi:MAG: carboxypeptidase-like regulatory domain-containing protein [Pyrinomonadaceae bacterium]